MQKNPRQPRSIREIRVTMQLPTAHCLQLTKGNFMEPVIIVENLTKTYRMGTNEVHALDGVSFQVQAGEFVGLMGPSGSGKSTLLHLLGCLDRPTSGRYLLAGQDVSRLTNTQRATVRNRSIGFIFQQFNLLPRISALDNVLMPLLYRGRAADARKRAAAALAVVGLQDRAHHRPTALSG